MINTVKYFLNNYNLQNSTIIVGFSGGYDSMALLFSLIQLKEKLNLKICAAHLNHGWRAATSDKEEENCKAFCAKNNISFYSKKLSSKIPKTETAAREARYTFFEEAAKYFKSNIIFTAHNANDNAETLIYRIAKGTGIKGLTGIEETRKINNIIIYRPILSLTRKKIEDFCLKNNLDANNDKSNYDTSYKRNFIRHEIMPKLVQINNSSLEAINSLSSLAKENEEIIDEYLKNIKNKIYKNKKYQTENFVNFSNSIKSRLIYDFITQLNLEYDRKKINEILQFIEENKNSKSGKTLSLSTNLWLYCNKDKFYTITRDEKDHFKSLEIKDIENNYHLNNYIFSAEQISTFNNKFPKENEPYAVVSMPKLSNLTLRYRQEGDIIQPFGLDKTIKLKKYFINKGVANHEKDKIVLLCNNNEVLWAYKVGISEKLRVTTNPTHILRIDEV